MQASTETNDPFAPTMPPMDTGVPSAPIDWEAWVTDHPLTAILAATAAGAGAIALMSMAPARTTVPPKVKQASSGAAGELAALRDQVSDLARRLLAKTPGEDEVSRSASSVGDAILEAWKDVRDQATGMAERIGPQVAEIAGRVRPQIKAAARLAKRNPLWVGLALGLLGGLAASRCIPDSDSRHGLRRRSE